ncbi:hypothetical protein JNUCC1_00863 [Lentibacillus sp. JNUCC-1]|uniref:tripartite tricarboxylate transporter TctB family protein n=1 Tax=Lentibacillus sp. JNUCC-1 TaxID=2654513 RepID=UPI0012E77266|nr:tripartite tricarboxylate transporter TctB family protein [Lentibacillus sp. JNUCC-1]MUV37057.1 hypothetical protein [Lentibacillus sp. JNUCC-1]
MKLSNYISGIITIVIGVFFYTLTFSFKKLGNQLIGAEFMPRVYCGLLIVLGFILLVQTYRDKSKKDEKKNTMKYALGTMVIVLLYIIVIPLVGFYLATVFTILGLLLFSKVKNKIIIFLLPIGTVAFVYVAFDKLLKVSIPIGSLFS